MISLYLADMEQGRDTSHIVKAIRQRVSRTIPNLLEDNRIHYGIQMDLSDIAAIELGNCFRVLDTSMDEAGSIAKHGSPIARYWLQDTRTGAISPMGWDFEGAVSKISSHAAKNPHLLAQCREAVITQSISTVPMAGI